jgi:hypothetical protein
LPQLLVSKSTKIEINYYSYLKDAVDICYFITNNSCKIYIFIQSIS